MAHPNEPGWEYACHSPNCSVPVCRELEGRVRREFQALLRDFPAESFEQTFRRALEETRARRVDQTGTIR